MQFHCHVSQQNVIKCYHIFKHIIYYSAQNAALLDYKICALISAVNVMQS